MALTLVVETGAGLTNSNSYATAAEGDSYHETLPSAWTSNWTSAVTAQKEASLVFATRLLDEQCNWNGSAVSTTQALRFPRSGVYTPDGVLLVSTAVPAFLKRATAELGRLLLISNLAVDAESREVTSRSESPATGSTSVSYAAGSSGGRARVLPEAVLSMLRPYCSFGTAKVFRV